MVKSNKPKNKVKELCSISMEEYIKDNGEITIKREKAIKNLQMDLFTLEVIRKVNRMDTASMNGKMAKYMKGNGLKG